MTTSDIDDWGPPVKEVPWGACDNGIDGSHEHTPLRAGAPVSNGPATSRPAPALILLFHTSRSFATDALSARVAAGFPAPLAVDRVEFR